MKALPNPFARDLVTVNLEMGLGFPVVFVTFKPPDHC
tara:strand:- start:6757 stop:6867 length:111 start_codon:yes stop_codon:yes gene_type:complete